MLELLQLIPGLNIRIIEKGCTGMAGTFGLAAENFQQSLRIGAALIEEMRTVDAVAGVTDCSSCRMQMEQSSSIPTIHPIKLLALSYGLMPRLADRLNVGQGLMPIDVRFPLAQKVEVGTVQDIDRGRVGHGNGKVPGSWRARNRAVL